MIAFGLMKQDEGLLVEPSLGHSIAEKKLAAEQKPSCVFWDWDRRREIVFSGDCLLLGPLGGKGDSPAGALLHVVDVPL